VNTLPVELRHTPYGPLIAVGEAVVPVQHPSLTCPLQLSSNVVVHNSVALGFIPTTASLQSALFATYPLGWLHAD
jgi:hypothetical protein